MALEPLSSKRYEKRTHKKKPKRLLLALLLTSLITPNLLYARRLEDYAAFQTKVTKLIAGARKSITIASVKMRDSALAASLYLARYRGVKTRVLLPKKEALAPQGQGIQLQKYGMPVSTPKIEIFREGKTLLFVDGVAYTSANTMDPSQKSTHYTLNRPHAKQTIELSRLFHIPIKTVKPKPKKHQETPRKQKKDAFGRYRSYYYGRGGSQKAPSNVARKLPQTPKWKKK